MNKILLFFILILFTANGCTLMYQIPKAGGKTGNYTDNTLLLIAHDHSLNDYYPITYQIILEPRSPSGNESCWIRGSCKNIKKLNLLDCPSISINEGMLKYIKRHRKRFRDLENDKSNINTPGKFQRRIITHSKIRRSRSNTTLSK